MTIPLVMGWPEWPEFIRLLAWNTPYCLSYCLFVPPSSTNVVAAGNCPSIALFTKNLRHGSLKCILLFCCERHIPSTSKMGIQSITRMKTVSPSQQAYIGSDASTDRYYFDHLVASCYSSPWTCGNLVCICMGCACDNSSLSASCAKQPVLFEGYL